MAYIGKQPASAALTGSDIADGIITEAKMADDAISLAELKAGNDGEIITWDASGNPVAVAVGTSGHFLKSQGAGSVPVFAAATGETNKPAFFANRSSAQSVANDTWTKIECQNEVLDTGGCYDNSTNFRFLPTTAGYYFLFCQLMFNTATQYCGIAKNGSLAVASRLVSTDTDQTVTATCVLQANGSSDYFEMRGIHGEGSSIDVQSAELRTHFGGWLIHAT